MASERWRRSGSARRRSRRGCRSRPRPGARGRRGGRRSRGRSGARARVRRRRSCRRCIPAQVAGEVGVEPAEPEAPRRLRREELVAARLDADPAARRRAAAGDDLHDAAHRARAVERRVGAAHDLEARRAVGREGREVEAAEIGVVQRDAVPEHQRVARVGAAGEQRGRLAGRAGAHDLEAGDRAQEIDRVERLARLDRRGVEHVDRDGDAVGRLFDCGGGDGDRGGERRWNGLREDRDRRLQEPGRERRQRAHLPLPLQAHAPPSERGGRLGRRGHTAARSPHPGGGSSDGGGRSPGSRIFLLPALPASGEPRDPLRIARSLAGSGCPGFVPGYSGGGRAGV